MRNPNILAALLSSLGCSRSREEVPVPVAEDKPAVSVSAKSGDLKATVVVPTLDTPVSEGKSAVWCSTLALAWKEYRLLVLKKRGASRPFFVMWVDNAELLEKT
jgi:hypothetical protein